MNRLTVKIVQRKQNCWEIMRCGREPGGLRADDLGVCPAAADRRFDGVNGGINGGRTCWAVAGTDGCDRPECIRANASHPCTACDFYRSLQPDASDQDLIERRRIPVTIENYSLHEA